MSVVLSLPHLWHSWSRTLYSLLPTQGLNGQGESGWGGESREPHIQELHTPLYRQVFQVGVKIQ